MCKTTEDFVPFSISQDCQVKTFLPEFIRKTSFLRNTLWLTDINQDKTCFPSSRLDFQEIQESNFILSNSNVFTLLSSLIGFAFLPLMFIFYYHIVYVFFGYASQILLARRPGILQIHTRQKQANIANTFRI